MNQQTILLTLLGIGILIIALSYIREIFHNKKNVLPQKNWNIQGNPLPLQLQLQAYERLVLFIERIAPDHLILQVNQPNFSVTEMEHLLINQIKSEFDYNLAQQIYVSPQAWEAVRIAKEQEISLIINLASQLPKEATGMDLNKRILDFMLRNEDPFSTRIALDVLTSAARKLLENPK